MDLLVVAAATGAGYIAKYWQNLSGQKDGLPDSSSLLSLNSQSDIGNVLQQIPDRPLPLRKLARKLLDEDLSSNNKDVWDVKLKETDEYVVKNEGYDVGPVSCIPREAFRQNVAWINGKHLRSTRRHSLDFVRSVEGYRFNVGAALPSPLMPLRVSDACPIICRTNSGSNDLPSDGGSITMRLPKKPEKKDVKGQNFSTTSKKQMGDRMLLLFTGITIGAMANTVASESEVDKLNELLKQAESLVSNLQEELELKDKLTMEELPGEDNQLSRTNSPALFSSEMVSSSSKPDFHIIPGQMTEIEAELEAELERLEFNMKTPTFENISDFVELDPDYEVEMVKGELKIDTDHDKSGTTGEPFDDADYAVSPWELTLRLHELIESRLNSRIEQLEIALVNSQRQSQRVESLHVTSLSGFDHREVESLSTCDSPTLPLPSEGQRAQRWEDWTSSRGSNEVTQSEDEDEDDAFGKVN